MDKRWKIILSFVVVFAAGAVVGGVFATSQAESQRKQWRERAKDGEQERQKFSDRAIRHYTERLNLTPEQVDQIRPVLEEAGEEMRRVRMDWSKNTASVAEELNKSIAAILTPEQKIEFEKHIGEMKTRMERMRGKGRPGMRDGPPRPPPPRSE